MPEHQAATMAAMAACICTMTEQLSALRKEPIRETLKSSMDQTNAFFQEDPEALAKVKEIIEFFADSTEVVD